MIEVICPKCGRENEYKPKKYEARPVRVLWGKESGRAWLTCIMCGWERRLTRIGVWWWERYEKNYRERYN